MIIFYSENNSVIINDRAIIWKYENTFLNFNNLQYKLQVAVISQRKIEK